MSSQPEASINIEYVAEKTVAKFHASRAFVRGIMGPIGSGKSVGCINEMMRISLAQKPYVDGIARTRWAVIRNTYPELKSTTMGNYFSVYIVVIWQNIL